MKSRFLLTFISASGLLGVVLGAFGAHALHATLLRHGTTQVWETAVMYQFIHTLALLGIFVWAQSRQDRWSPRLLWAARFWMAGIVLFSGSLYGLALGGPILLGPVTPLGGLGFILGWGCLFVEALKSKPAAES